MTDEARVLVVDDDADAAESLMALLNARGYQTHVARDGVEALAAVERYDPDCVLLDLNMPRLSGAEVANALRQGKWRHVVLVAVSGRGDLGIESEDLRSVDHWLEKPIDFARFNEIFPDVSS